MNILSAIWNTATQPLIALFLIATLALKLTSRRK